MIELKNDNWLGTCRGVAVVGVVMTHLLPQINTAFNLNSKIIEAITVDIIDIGKIGVVLLFLIAGYLTPTSKKRRNTKQFVVNRFFRLYPLYWLDIMLVGVLFRFDGLKADTVIANVTMLQVFLGKEDLVGLFWTLPIELLLYMGAVILEKNMWQFKKIFPIEIICSLGTIGIALVRKIYWKEAPVAIGLLLTIAILGQIFRLHKNGETTKNQIVGAISVFVVCLIISSILAYSIDTGHQEHWWRYVFSYSIAIITFLCFMLSGKTIRLFNCIANIAYPLYLLQEIVFRVAFEKFFYVGINAILFIGGTTLSLAVFSIIAKNIFEKPLLELSKKVEIMFR